MKKLTKILFVGALALSFAPLGVMTLTSLKAPTQVMALDGAGTEENPYTPTTYSELKQLLEGKYDVYIRVDNFQNSNGMNYYSLQPNVDYTPAGWGQVDAGAIVIPYGYTKHLTINTDIDCRATSLQDNSLLYSFINNVGNLYINGTGSLKVGFNASNNPNAIVFNRNYLSIAGDVTLDATQKSINSYGSAICEYSSSSKMDIYSGTFIGNNASESNNDIGAVRMLDSTSLDGNNNVSHIYGGEFYSTLTGTGQSFVTGLLIESNSLKLAGGSFRGIRIRTSSVSNYYLSDLLDEGCSYELNGESYDGSSNTTQVKTLKVKNPSRTISQVDLSVDNPLHGAMPGEVISTTSHVSVSNYEWSTNSAFVGGTSVLVQAYVVLESGYSFSNNTRIRVNGVTEEQKDLSNQNYYILRKYYDIEKPTPTSLNNIAITVDEPSAGDIPGEPSVSDARVSIKTYEWTPSSSFVGGSNSRLTIMLEVNDASQYSLASLTNATINGHSATIQSAQAGYAIVYYTFAIANPTYTVSFNSNGGSGTMADETDQYGGYVLPDNGFTAPSGKHLVAWAVGSASGEQYKVGEEYNVIENITFYAIWEENAFTRQPISQAKNIDGGETEISPDWDVNFTATKYEIYKNGSLDQTVTHKWFDADSNVTASYNYKVRAYYDETNYIESDQFTLSWTTNIRQVIYQPGDASGDSNIFEHVTGDTVAFFDEDYFYYSYAGHVFDYWSIRILGDNFTEVAQKHPGDTYTLTDSIIAVATWREKEVDSVIASYNGGTVSAGFTLDTNALEMKLCYEDSSFDNLDINQVGIEIKNGSNFESIDVSTYTFETVGTAILRITSEGKTTLVEIEVVGYTVSFNANGGEGLQAPLTNKYGTTALPNTCTFVPPSGKQFKGWSTSANGDVVTSIDVDGEVTLFAIWEDATATSMVASYSSDIKADGHIDLSKVKIVVSYSNGEQLNVDGSDANVTYWEDAEHQITNINSFSFNKVGSNNIIVKYKGIQTTLQIVSTGYSISFDSNGGEGTMKAINDVYGSYVLPSCTITAPDGKTFDAWQVNGQKVLPNQSINVTSDTIITALWKDIPAVTYTVHFDANGGTGSMADVPGQSGDYALPQCDFVAPANKEFKCWSVGGVEKNPGDIIQVTSDVTVTALWKDATPEPAKELTSITLSGTYKTEFEVGDSFSAEGLVVTAHYSDDSSEVIDLNNVEITGYNMNQEGKQTITVSYQGKTATYEITVKAKDTPVTPDDPVTPNKSSGLPVGAVVGIVIGSAMVVGIGGFALVWFVIKKKTWADFLALFKKK